MINGASGVYVNLVITILAAPFFAGGLALVYRCFDWRRKMRGRLLVAGRIQASRRRMVIWATVLFLFQPMVVSACFQIFTCAEVGDKMVMYSDMRVECWSGGHLVWVGLVALPAVVGYVVVVPGLVLTHMNRFFADGIQEDQDEEALRIWG